VEKYGRTMQTTDNNIFTAQVCCMSDNQGMNADTHSEYVILSAFSQQKWLRERASMLRLHVHCPIVDVNVRKVESDVIKFKKTSNLQIQIHIHNIDPACLPEVNSRNM
jgi:hypothetical protein